jgi:hypothetical protein
VLQFMRSTLNGHVKRKILRSFLRISLRQRPKLLSAASGLALSLNGAIGVCYIGLDQTDHNANSCCAVVLSFYVVQRTDKGEVEDDVNNAFCLSEEELGWTRDLTVVPVFGPCIN